MKISPHFLAQLQEQIRLKDQAAHALGVACAEFELGKARLLLAADEMSAPERHVRRGALEFEMDKYRSTHMGSVVKASARQKEIGETALAAVGLASQRRVFTIDPKTGEVLELVAGAYVPVQEAA